MQEIYFTSDLHLCHNKEFIYKARGFNSIEEHDEQIIKNINEIVGKNDILYILGDLVLNNTDKGVDLLQKIVCQDIRIIIGNHDSDLRMAEYIHSLDSLTMIVVSDIYSSGKTNYHLSHYPVMVKNYSNYDKRICLHGHTHSKDRFELFENYRCYNVGLDAHNLKPVSLEEVMRDCNIKKQEIESSNRKNEKRKEKLKNTKKTYELVSCYFNEEDLSSIAKIKTEIGCFVGISCVHEDDRENANQFFGGRLAEAKAVLAWRRECLSKAVKANDVAAIEVYKEIVDRLENIVIPQLIESRELTLKHIKKVKNRVK